MSDLLVVDAAARLDPQAVKAAGFVGAIRYIAPWLNGRPNPKCITRSELEADVAAGLPVAFVFEQGIHNVEGGVAQGTRDGQVAVGALRDLGIPDGAGAHVYFAVDEDVPVELWATVAGYLDAAARELAAAGHVRNGYGKFALGRQMLADGHAVKWWESGAWSGSNRLQGTPGAALYQRIQTATVGGVQCDVNEVWEDDWGQWPRPAAPKPAPKEEENVNRVLVHATPKGTPVIAPAMDGSPYPVHMNDVLGLVNTTNVRSWARSTSLVDDQANVFAKPAGDVWVTYR